jgi:DNA-binding transcriptional MocR family regulator
LRFKNHQSRREKRGLVIPDERRAKLPLLLTLLQVPGLNAEQLRSDAKKLSIAIRAGSFFTTRRLYRDCFRINTGWALTDAYDDNRTVEQALRQLLSLVINQ